MFFTRSDSSMVDEYQIVQGIPENRNAVQIPLWSMNTMPGLSSEYSSYCSDSSMVDEYLAGYTCIFPEKLCSDSSMVDEYLRAYSNTTSKFLFRFLYGRWIPLFLLACKSWKIVQIPLWSMNTIKSHKSIYHSLGSDSSMVDEYLL